jgi:hypothetical protein
MVQLITPLSLVPLPIDIVTITLAVVTTSGIFAFIYVTVWNYSQDMGMKTKHKQSLLTRVANFTDRRSEIEKIKQREEENTNND